MLSSFLTRNFRSILELRLDLSFAEGKAPNGYKTFEIMPFLESGDKQRLVPCAAFFGANAAGKTNLLKAVSTLKTLLREGGLLADLFEPNLLNPKFSETTFEPAFVIGADAFTYRITYSHKSISEELLLKNGEPVFHIQRLTPTFSSALFSPPTPRKNSRTSCASSVPTARANKPSPFFIASAEPTPVSIRI